MPHPIMFSDEDPLLGRLREIALSFPGAGEKVSHGRPNFFTARVFASYGGSRRLSPSNHERHEHALLFRPEAADLPALGEDRRFFRPAYVGAYGWRGIDLDAPDLDWDEVTELVDASYRLTAPKKLITELDAGRGADRQGAAPLMACDDKAEERRGAERQASDENAASVRHQGGHSCTDGVRWQG